MYNTCLRIETYESLIQRDIYLSLYIVSKGKQTDLILFEFSKAFDKVNHSKILWKLHQYGIRGHALAWIRAFLWNRSQTVVLEGEESESVLVTSVVPQSSVLGPIMFLIVVVLGIIHTCIALRYKPAFTATQ